MYPKSEKEKNRLWIPQGSPPPDMLPFYLYSLPVDMIMDIMWRKLAIAVVANIGKVAAALQEVGIDAIIPNNKKNFNQSFLSISAERTILNNQPVKIELHQAHSIGLKIFYEFLSLQGFVGSVAEMIEAAQEQANNWKG